MTRYGIGRHVNLVTDFRGFTIVSYGNHDYPVVDGLCKDSAAL